MSEQEPDLDAALPDHLANEQRLLSALRTAQRKSLTDSLRRVLQSVGDTSD